MIGNPAKKKTILPISMIKRSNRVITSQVLVRLSIVECIPQAILTTNKIPQQMNK